MNTEFRRHVEQMPHLMDALRASLFLARNRLRNIPDEGIFVFYEHDRPMFVGRSDNLRAYIMGQGRAGSDHYNAPFAYKLAKEQAAQQGLPEMPAVRAVLDRRFIPLFDAAKKRVANMAIRVIGVTDPIEQTLFVIYAALELGTPYNDFETH